MISLFLDHNDAVDLVGILDHIEETTFGPTKDLVHNIANRIREKLGDED